MKRIVSGVMLTLLLIGILSLTLNPISAPLPTSPPTDWPSVFFCGESVPFCTLEQPIVAEVGETVSVALVVFNLTDNQVPDPQFPTINRSLGNLSGIEVQMSWDPTILKLVSYTVTVPVEDYPNPISPSPYAGILHEDTFRLMKKVDEMGNIPNAEPGTMAWFAYATMPDAPAFNGNGTFFTMTFNVTDHGSSSLKLTKVGLADQSGGPLLWHQYDGFFHTPEPPVANFTFWPDVGTVNKTMIFDASESYSPLSLDIVSYSWDFGDGNITTVNDAVIHHTYAVKGNYTVSLRVTDSEETISSAATAILTVVETRDVGITSVKPLRTVVGQTYTCPINVTIANRGNYTETFNVTVYANTTSIASQIITLTSGNSTTLTFTWNTTGFARGNYTIWAFAEPVPGETDIENNVLYSDVEVCVTIPGDVDADFDVDLYDAVKLLVCYGAKEGGLDYNSVCDIDGDGDIDLYDAVILLTHYGEKYP